MLSAERVGIGSLPSVPCGLRPYVFRRMSWWLWLGVCREGTAPLRAELRRLQEQQQQLQKDVEAKQKQVSLPRPAWACPGHIPCKPSCFHFLRSFAYLKGLLPS